MLSEIDGESVVNSEWSPVARSPIRASVDLDGFGKAIGHFAVPWSRDESGWGNLLTPLAVVANGDGPTVLLTGGNHGDEYEGPVALRRLVHELDPSTVTGRVIIVPALNQAALHAGTRLSPIDGGNLNRSFPGSPTGTTTERIADFVYRELVARADVVLDLHSGGRSMVFEPFVATHDLRDRAQFAITAEYIKTFGTGLAVVAVEPDPDGMIDTAVEALGKIFLTTEIMGGRAVSARSVAIARRGISNTLKQAGVIAGEPIFEAPPAFVRMVDDGSSLAPFSGLFEPLVDPGDEVTAGAAVARIHVLDDLSAEPALLHTEIGGVVIMRHNPGLIRTGDPAVAVAEPTEAPWDSTSPSARQQDRSSESPYPGREPT